MSLEFKIFDKINERLLLADWLASEQWPYHVNSQLSVDKALGFIDEGLFDGEETKSFWIIQDAIFIGIIRLIDLDDVEDGNPLFDLRIKSDFRGRGIGETSVRWLSKYFFETWPQLERIEGTTRVDNVSMRKVFVKCGFAKEGHSRKSWPDKNGVLVDSVRYALLREDWESGKVTPVQWDDL